MIIYLLGEKFQEAFGDFWIIPSSALVSAAFFWSFPAGICMLIVHIIWTLQDQGSGSTGFWN
jgi:hypothetical protein